MSSAAKQSFRESIRPIRTRVVGQWRRPTRSSFRSALVVLVCGFLVNSALVHPADKSTKAATPLSEAEQMKFANAFERAVKKGTAKDINELIDWNKLFDKAHAGEDSAALNKLRKEYKADVLRQLTQDNPVDLTAGLVQNSKEGGSFKFLQLMQVDNEPAALFRIVGSIKTQVVNYHVYYLTRASDGRTRAYDLMVMTAGERYSDSLRRAWLPFVRKVSPPSDADASRTDEFSPESIESLNQMRKLIREGKGDEALAVYGKLPEQVQQVKSFKITRFQAAMMVSTEARDQAIEDFRQRFPQDLLLDILLINVYRRDNEFEKALECVDRARERLGTDASLLGERASLLGQLGRFEEANETLNKAFKMESGFAPTYWSGVTISLAEKNDDQTARYLTIIENDLHMSLGDLSKVPEFADFVKSPQYAKWKKSRK